MVNTRRTKKKKTANQKKKLVEMKSALVDLEKNLNIVMEMFKFKFF